MTTKKYALSLISYSYTHRSESIEVGSLEEFIKKFQNRLRAGKSCSRKVKVRPKTMYELVEGLNAIEERESTTYQYDYYTYTEIGAQ